MLRVALTSEWPVWALQCSGAPAACPPGAGTPRMANRDRQPGCSSALHTAAAPRRRSATVAAWRRRQLLTQPLPLPLHPAADGQGHGGGCGRQQRRAQEAGAARARGAAGADTPVRGGVGAGTQGRAAESESFGGTRPRAPWLQAAGAAGLNATLYAHALTLSALPAALPACRPQLEPQRGQGGLLSL